MNIYQKNAVTGIFYAKFVFSLDLDAWINEPPSEASSDEGSGDTFSKYDNK